MKRHFFLLCRSLTVIAASAVYLTLGLEVASAQLSALKKSSEPKVQNVDPTTPAVSPLVGAWQGEYEGHQQRAKFLLMLNPNGNYKARIIIENAPGPNGPSEPTVADFAGQWKTEGQELVLRNQADNSVERSGIELQGDRLTLKGIGPNGELVMMERVQPQPNPNVNGPNNGASTGPNFQGSQPEPVFGTNPTGPGSQKGQLDQPANHPPMVGTWFASGTVEGTHMECQVTIQPNGTYQAEFLFKEGRVTSQVTEIGQWKVRGGRMLFKSEDEDVVSVPFQVHGDSLMLDYSEEIGLIANLSRTPGKGQIRPAYPNGF